MLCTGKRQFRRQLRASWIGVTQRRRNIQWLTGTSSRSVPTSLMRFGGPSTPLVPRTLTSKNLTVQSLLLTATRGSALLSFDRVRLREVRRTELLMDPDRTLSYCHSLLDGRGEAGSEGLRGGELRLECIDRWSSASWPPAARRRSFVSGMWREAMVFGT